MREHEELLQEIRLLVQAIHQYTQANQQLTQALIDIADDEAEEDDDPVTYLDGSRRAS